MGNLSPASTPAVPRPEKAQPRKFYTSSSWIEGRAVEQAETVARLEGVRSVAVFPDLHPGKYGPVGAAVLSERVHPLLVGNDVGCGMALFALDLPLRKLSAEKAARRLRRLQEEWDGDAAALLEAAGLDPELFPGSVGTIGGGNHFCELQAVDETFVPGFVEQGRAYLLVHSGSRAFGERVLSSVPDGKGMGMPANDPDAVAYLRLHDQAVAWARLNRRVIAHRAAAALCADAEEICDVPHNLVKRRGDCFVHYKGAAAPDAGALAPVAGSRASLSFVVRALAGPDEALGGISHGAGRKYDRASMHRRVGRVRSERDAMARNPWGGHVVCEDRDLMVEEAAQAYKDAGRVVADLQSCGLVEPVAAMRPLVTFKKARTEGDGE